MADTGEVWTLKVLGTHLLVGGETGAGKGSVVWSLLRGLAPAIRSGLVEVWAVDPKGGMELGMGRNLFARFVPDDPQATLRLLGEGQQLVHDRARRLAGKVRVHEPTVREPLVLIVLDECASLTAYQPDPKMAKLTKSRLAVLLTQGRAVGVSVVGAVQDPRKEVLDVRGLFPDRVALRLREAAQVDMVLGEGARARGARCDDPRVVPASLPGVGFVQLEGQREPARVRASWISDDDIRAMAAEYGPLSTPSGRLLAVMAGHSDGAVPLTKDQAAEVDAMTAAWAAEDA
jgi:S-DNA-T family DNA segregation ATPase FtsK/SpoIIIE